MKEKPVFGTSKCAQVGILVHNMEKSVQAYAAFLGVDVPAICQTGEYEEARTLYLGRPTRARCRQAFFYYNDLQVELIEPDKEPSVWRQALDEKGEGIHHIAFQIENMEETIRLGESLGMKLLQRGRWNGGHYAYLDASSTLHCVVELLENGDFDL